MNLPANSPNLTDRIRHAESYPFARPACSYLFEGGKMRPLWKDAFEGRLPVIASGSNASPTRLAAKFRDNEKIPVTRAELRHFAVVFAGHFTAYGAIPATLAPCEGAVTEVWITWLTRAELAVMHRSEGVLGCREAEQRYDFFDLSGIDLGSEQGGIVDEAGAYLSRRMLAMDGEPIRLAEVRTQNCPFPALSERAALRHAASHLRPTQPFPDLMETVLQGPERRQALFRELTPHTILRSAGFTVADIEASLTG